MSSPTLTTSTLQIRVVLNAPNPVYHQVAELQSNGHSRRWIRHQLEAVLEPNS